MSDLEVSELRECMADPHLTYHQWEVIRNRVLELSGEGVPSSDFFEGQTAAGGREPPPSAPNPDLLREMNVAGGPRLVELDGEMVDPSSMPAKERIEKFGNDNPISGAAMSAADYRKFMSGVKG